MGSPATKEPDFAFSGVSTNDFAVWFSDNVEESVIEYDSGIKMHTWMGVPKDMTVEFGSDHRFHFSAEMPKGTKGVVTLFDGTNVGMYQRSVVRKDDRITIVYIPENLLTINYFGNDDQ